MASSVRVEPGSPHTETDQLLRALVSALAVTRSLPGMQTWNMKYECIHLTHMTEIQPAVDTHQNILPCGPARLPCG